MLVLKRKEGQWIRITHRSGDVLRFRVYDLHGGGLRGDVSIAFDDRPRNFLIQRPERVARGGPSATTPEPGPAQATPPAASAPPAGAEE